MIKLCPSDTDGFARQSTGATMKKNLSIKKIYYEYNYLKSHHFKTKNVHLVYKVVVQVISSAFMQIKL